MERTQRSTSSLAVDELATRTCVREGADIAPPPPSLTSLFTDPLLLNVVRGESPVAPG